MIPIIKPNKGPKRLTKRGLIQTTEDCANYDASPGAYRSCKKTFRSKRGIFASKAVKKMLSDAQHNKCCFCEKRFRAAINLAVEHFRPKQGVRQSRTLKAQYPGYYWLAYDWDNLLLSCHDCNSTFKQILFPLANPNQRARSHHHDIRIERPLLVNPATEDPRKHIRFRDDAPEPRTARGRATIDVLGLRRASLREDRLEKLALLRYFADLRQISAKKPRSRELKKLADRAQEFLDSAILADAEFSSMAQDFSAR